MISAPAYFSVILLLLKCNRKINSNMAAHVSKFQQVEEAGERRIKLLRPTTLSQNEKKENKQIRTYSWHLVFKDGEHAPFCIQGNLCLIVIR